MSNYKIVNTLLFLIIIYLHLERNNFVYSYSPYDYCSIPGSKYEQDRKIPFRDGLSMKMKLNLNQVQVIIRHGSRTPSDESSNTCFPKMRSNPPSWNCSYREKFNGANFPLDHLDSDKTMTFEQVFDAQPELNVLTGTCRLGQLMANGIDQLNTLGDILFKAYFSENPLFDIQQLNSNPNLLYLRSTDVQRTRHSAAILISKIFKNFYKESQQVFNKDLQLHLVDNRWDSMSGSTNEKKCPEIENLYNAYFESSEYQQLKNKNKSLLKEIASLQEEELDPFWFMKTIDCYMSLLCHNIQEYLPDELKINDNSNFENSFGYKLYDLIEQETALFATWNNGVISKCDSKYFLNEFMKGFNVSSTITDQISSKAKFSLYSAHDTTLLHFLSSLDQIYDKRFPSYASMLTFEIYKDQNDEAYFRIIYNGQDQTNGISGCSKSKIFVDEGVCPFSFLNQTVHDSLNNLVPETSLLKFYNYTENNKHQNNYIFIYICISFILGSISTYLISYLSKRNKAKTISFEPLI